MNAPIAPKKTINPDNNIPANIITIKMIARIKKVINNLMGKNVNGYLSFSILLLSR